MTKLTGRYIEFELFPLTFDEYLKMKEFLGKHVNPDAMAEFEQYIREGGFPKTLDYESTEDKSIYIQSVLSEIFEKDIRRRVQIRNVSVFEQVQRYIINNFGATTPFRLNNVKAGDVAIISPSLNTINQCSYCAACIRQRQTKKPPI